MALFEVKDLDKKIYVEELKDFLPDKILDVHTHVWLKEMKDKGLYDIVAVCDVEADRLEKMKKEYGCKTYKRVEDIVEDPEIEVIDIATRSCDHFVHAMTALQAGKTVFLEKPITMNYDEAKKLFVLVFHGFK